MRIRPLLREDIPLLSSIASEVFWDDDLFAWLCPHRDRYADDFRAYFVRRYRIRCASLLSHMFVAETEETDAEWQGSSQLVGGAVWERRGNSNAARSWQSDSFFKSTHA